MYSVFGVFRDYFFSGAIHLTLSSSTSKRFTALDARFDYHVSITTNKINSLLGQCYLKCVRYLNQDIRPIRDDLNFENLCFTPFQ